MLKLCFDDFLGVALFVLEPYAIKVARTVLRGGKREISYLSQLETLVVHTLLNILGKYLLGVNYQTPGTP